MPLHIITQKPNNYFSKEYLKTLARKIFHKKRGPQAVVASLIRGLKELNYPYKLNAKIELSDTVYVNESLSALRWAVKLKKQGKINKLIAGPNLVVTPDEYSSLIASPEIDLYLTPSNWNRNWWLSIKPELANRLVVWPAGAEDRGATKEEAKKIVLVYKKTVPENLFAEAIEKLKANKLNYQVINYGEFKQSEYFSLLAQSQIIIYLQESESQGIALLEAWSRNIPTFVWNKGVLEYKNYIWPEAKISSPYLEKECGAFFKNSTELAELLTDFINKKLVFSPREYYLENFTDKICAANFFKLIN